MRKIEKLQRKNIFISSLVLLPQDMMLRLRQRILHLKQISISTNTVIALVQRFLAESSDFLKLFLVISMF